MGESATGAAGTGSTIAKASGADVPPPGAGLATVTVRGPVAAVGRTAIAAVI